MFMGFDLPRFHELSGACPGILQSVGGTGIEPSRHRTDGPFPGWFDVLCGTHAIGVGRIASHCGSIRQTHGRDMAHDPFGGDCIAFRIARTRVKGCRVDRREECGSDRDSRLELVAVFAEGVAGAEHACGDNRNSGAAGDHAQPVFHRLNVPIRTPGPFGENKDPVAILGGLNDAFHGADFAFGVPVDSDGPEFGQQPAHDRMIHEGVAGDVVNDGLDAGSYERDIQMTHMIGSQDEGSFSRNVGKPEIFHGSDRFEDACGECFANGVDEAFFHTSDWCTGISLESIF